ncbi:hypothetical protein [Tengunoibacter tsumagoiensis]|uniref:Uncharacterized protein n=1 Tax=Tengunoibacter tsumagoiensis TaxID=2014871 RepID=A0A402A3F1_9CHLR|nr:hypothetical protein [Tengunoibacter tsumagoiensis]GCE13680.1 hypothetical protein KTT_35390 [Tengunoibacter tsumagoiensis]
MPITYPSPLKAEVRKHLGKPTLWINEQPFYPMLYSLTDCPGGRWSWEEIPQRNIQHFANQGVTLFQVDLWLEQLFAPDDTLDITLAQRQVRGILAACPTAGVFIRLHVNAAPWWNAEHPDECTEYADIEADRTELTGQK